jgi:hypothetical protein
MADNDFPFFFEGMHFIVEYSRQGITENRASFLEISAMLPDICIGLLSVPLEL